MQTLKANVDGAPITILTHSVSHLKISFCHQVQITADLYPPIRRAVGLEGSTWRILGQLVLIVSYHWVPLISHPQRGFSIRQGESWHTARTTSLEHSTPRCLIWFYQQCSIVVISAVHYCEIFPRQAITVSCPSLRSSMSQWLANLSEEFSWMERGHC